jgi:CheY-like chemotaxis protein/HPt (histidine-containing phosphotransfer) domain-containing protein
VQDTGIGIPPDVQARLFKPFVQADDSTARKFGGTGLGLSICLQLSRLMKGNLTMGSVEGKGTRITLSIPAPQVPGSDAKPEFNLQGVEVTVIGSDEVERRHMAGCLAYWGAEVRAMAITDPTLPDGGHGIILAPLADESELRRLAKLMPPSLTQQRFVFFAFDNEPADRQSPERDAIRTVALSRARIVTAVAVAAGVVSPEVEAIYEIPEMERSGAPPDREQALRAGRLILLAEDHPLNRDVIIWQLHLLGYAVDAVESGTAALAAMGQTPYGLILTDCNMPEMDGFELTRRVRGDGGTLPILALTANAMVGEAEKCLAAGMDDFLSKPVDMPRLRACLEKWLPGSAAPLPKALPQMAVPEPSDVLDLSLLDECFGGDQEMIRKNLALFLEAMRADLDSLSAAVARNDGQEAERTAHRIKGAARFVGGAQLAAASETIEGLADRKDWPGIARDWNQLVAASDEIRRHIERQLAA